MFLTPWYIFQLTYSILVMILPSQGYKQHGQPDEGQSHSQKLASCVLVLTTILVLTAMLVHAWLVIRLQVSYYPRLSI